MTANANNSAALFLEYQAMMQEEADEESWLECKAARNEDWNKQELWAENGGYASGMPRPAFHS